MADCCCNDVRCSGKHIPLQAVIQECDRLFNQENMVQLGEHLRFWRRRAAELGDRKNELSLLSELMGHYRMMKDEQRGIAAIRDGFALLEELQLQETASAGTILLNGATALQSFGMGKEAMQYYRRAETCYEKNLTPGDPLFAGLYNNMASSCIDCGEFREAEQFYRKAIEIQKQNRNRMDLAVSFINLAQLFDALDPEDERIGELMDQARACFENTPADAYFAHTCRKCAPAFGYFGRFMDEQDLNQKADDFYAEA